MRERIGGNFFGVHGEIENKVREDDQPDGEDGGVSFAPEEQGKDGGQDEHGEQRMGPVVKEVCGVGRFETDPGEKYPDKVGQKCSGEEGPERRTSCVRGGGEGYAVVRRVHFVSRWPLYFCERRRWYWCGGRY